MLGEQSQIPSHMPYAIQIADDAVSPAPRVRVSKPLSAKHVPELDGLRGFAILIVAAYHFSIAFTKVSGPQHLLRTLFTPGWIGVDLFFVLSGYLITGILMDSKTSGSYFKRFYVRRILRIFPVYYAALLVCFTVARPLLEIQSASGGVTLAYFLHVSNWLSLTGREIPSVNHFWSLAVEEQFYLCWPLAVYLLSKRHLTWLCGLILVAAPAIRFALLTHLPAEIAERAAYAWTPARIDTLALGALLAIAVRSGFHLEALKRDSLPLAAGLTVLLGAWFGLKARLGLEVPLTKALLPSVLAAAFAMIVIHAVLAVGSRDNMSRILKWGVLQQAGRFSYAAYVIHFPLMIVTFAWFEKLPDHARNLLALPYFLGGIAATFVLAAISWHCMEKRILAYKDLLAP